MHRAWIGFTILLTIGAAAQTENRQISNSSMPGMDMSSGKDGDVHDMPGTGGTVSAVHAMEGHRMDDMGPHMKMTALRPVQPGDQLKAEQILHSAREAAEKYQDYKIALADGYKIFLPSVPQKMYHFTNYGNAFYARNHFDPSRPTSLLYEKSGDGYKLVGVMYTAKKGADEEELNSRVPLSIAQWHAHVNFCAPPRGRKQEATMHDPTFGFSGSITTKEACDAAGGKFYPQIFGWMVHVYPFEQKPEDIWSMERQHTD